MKHTPGPWMAMLKPFGGFTIAPLKGGGRREIGSVLFRHDKIDIVSEVDANARLIAAAPELLEALKEQIEPRSKGWKVTDWDIRDANARAAIAKAEGRD